MLTRCGHAAGNFRRSSAVPITEQATRQETVARGFNHPRFGDLDLFIVFDYSSKERCWLMEHFTWGFELEYNAVEEETT